MASVAQSTQTERLNQIFNGLKNRNADIRLQSAEDLRRFVSTTMALVIPQLMI
jgi:FKBP12-rapamycin complex-associated protein